MKNEPTFVLDNNVLSGARVAGWFGSLEFWDGDASLVVPARIWQHEFQSSSHSVEEAPGWLCVKESQSQTLDVRAEG